MVTPDSLHVETRVRRERERQVLVEWLAEEAVQESMLTRW